MFAELCEEALVPEGGGLFAGAGLDFYEDVQKSHGGGSYAGEARGLSDGLRTEAGEFFFHLARETADGSVVEPVGDGFGFGFLEALDGLVLLLEISGEFDFGFDGLEFVADRGRKLDHGFTRIDTDFWGKAGILTADVTPLVKMANARYHHTFTAESGNRAAGGSQARIQPCPVT